MQFKTIESLLEFAKSRRGEGWLGAMELIESLQASNITDDVGGTLQGRMEKEMGTLIFSGTLGCDEYAMMTACNQCIESVIRFLDGDTFR